MFSYPQIARQSIKGISMPMLADQRCERNSCIQDLNAHSKKIETRNSMLSPSLKSSIINDCDYNSSIYEWRKQQIAPIVNVIELAKRSEIDNITGASRIFNTIKPEPYHCTLSNFREFSKQQILYIFKSLLEGYQAIFKKMKATSVSLQKCIINQEGLVKVWVNQQFQRNDISGEILSKQEFVTKRIFQMVCFLAFNNPHQKIQDFLQYIESSINKSGKWTFNCLKGMIKSYCDCLRLKIPKNIQLKSKSIAKRPIQSSMINNQKPFQMERPRQKSFELRYRNAASSLNSSKTYIQQPRKFNFGDLLGSLVKNPTSKSINQNQTNCTIRTLPTKSKHTSSISKFRAQEDPVLQISGHKEQKRLVTISSVNDNKRRSSIDDLLLSKIGFCSLPEVHCEQQCSNCPSARKEEKPEEDDNDRRVSLTIASQFSLKIEKVVSENAKASSISTTNQTSDSCNQFCFSKKIKDSHMTINLDENKQNRNQNQDFRTASRDRFKDSILVTQTQPKKHIVGSCTNWSSKRDSIELSQISKQLRVSKFCTETENKGIKLNCQTFEALVQNNKVQKDIETSLKQLGIGDSINQTTPQKTFKQSMKPIIRNPITLLTQLRSVQQIQSYDNTQKNSISAQSQNPSSVRRLKMPIEQKILELLSLNRNLVVSTYMQTSSEKKIKQTDSPDKLRQRKLKDIEQTLSQLIHANLKQQEIIEGNKWTKRLENLLGIQQQMKQSISFGPEQACALLREIKLSKIGKWGRAIGSSRVETQECQ